MSAPGWIWFLAGALGGACAPSANRAVQCEPAPALSATPARSDAARSAPERPPAIVPPRDIACTLSAPAWPSENLDEGGGRHYLRFAPGGRPFARLYHGRNAELVVPAALPSAGGHVRIDSFGVVLEAHLEAAEMPLYAAAPLVLSGVFVPDNDRRLVWRSAKPGSIDVTVDAGPRVRPFGEDPLGGELACVQISLGWELIDRAAIDALIKAPPDDRDPNGPLLWLKPGRVGLSAVPGGDPVVEIDVVEPPDDTVLVQPLRVLAKAKGHTRIAMVPFGGTLFGWVRNDEIQRHKARYMDLSHDVDSRLVLKREMGGPFVVCDRELPLFAEVGGEQRKVGQVSAGTPFAPARTQGTWTVVDFPSAGFAPERDASLLVETSALASCKHSVVKEPVRRSISGQ